MRAFLPIAALSVLSALLAGCEADHVAARSALADLGFHGVAITPAPAIGRPCAWGEPFAVRFRAVRDDGVIVRGTLCSVDEASEDARLLPDAGGEL